MRFVVGVLLVALGLSIPLVSPASGPAESRPHDALGPLDASRFESPDAERRPTALWFWNGTVTEELIDRQLAEMRSEGIAEVALFPFKSFPSPPFREGVLQPPFFSEAWFGLVEHTLREAQRTGMRLWLFNDEYWPSGWGAGLVVNGGRVGDRVYEPRPDLRAQTLERQVRTVEGPASVDLAATDYSREEVVAVAALPVGGEQSGLAGVVDLTDEFRAGERWDAPAGRWRIEYYGRVYLDTLRRTGVGYPDLLNPEAVARFVDAVQGEYHRRFPWAFGNVLRGFWDDEPNIALRAGEVPWSHALPAQLRAAGKSPAEILPAVFDDHGRAGRVLKGEFWRAVLTLHAESHYRLQAEWAGERGVEMVSNPFGDTASVNFGLGGDLARNHQWSQVPGADAIFEEARGARTLLPRLAASAAHQNGRTRALSENFGGSGWDVTPQVARSTHGRLAARGMNLAVMHAYWLDPSYVHFPPPLDPSNTWWSTMDELVTWTGRVMEASRGQVLLETAVLQPQRAAEAWFRTGQIGAMQGGLEDAAFALEEAQVDFDLLSESYLDGDPAMRRHGEVRGGRLRVGPQGYRVVVMPPARTISLETVRQLTELARSGGTVVAHGSLPTEETRGRDAELHGAVTELFGTDPADPQPGERRLGAGSAAFAASVEDLQRRVVAAGAAAARLAPASSAVRVLRRERGGDRVFLVVNEGQERVETTAVFPERGTPELWDPDDGSHRIAPTFGALDGGTAVPLRLEPSEALVVAFRRASPPPQQVARLVRSPLEAQSVREAGPQRLLARVVAERPGTYPLLGRLAERTFAGTAEVEDPLEPIQLGGAWRFRFEQPGAAWQERPLGSWTELDPRYSGSALYETTVTLSEQDLAAGRRMLLDLGEVSDVAEVTINGEAAGRLAWQPYRLDVTDRLRPGPNQIGVRVANTPANAQGSALASGLLGPVTLRPLRIVDAVLRFQPNGEALAVSAPARVTVNPGQTRTIEATIANYAAAPARAELSATGEAPLVVDPERTPLELSGRRSTRVEVAVSVPDGAPPGTRELRLRAGDATTTVAVAVEERNVARDATASASSTNANFRPEWAINGDRSSATWSQGNGWNDNTRTRFPDWLQLTFPEPVTVGRLDLYTLDSGANPASGFGLRDWDVQAWVDGEWRTVAQVRDNEAGLVRSAFEPVTTSALRILVHGSNDGAYSRIIEVEAYRGAG